MSIPQLYEIITESLSRKSRLLVIDEAERLSVSELELLRDIYDEKDCGLCLVGLDSLRTLLQRGRSLRENLVQLYSRVGYQRIVDILDPADVEMIFDDRLKKYKVSVQMFKSLSTKFEKKGGIRAIIKLCNLALKVSEKFSVAIDDQVINECVKDLAL
jgi:DNA transposition AAA+ family ATPase